MTPTAAIRILHVDDEPDFARMAATFLERETDHLTVEPVTTVTTAADYLAEHQVDCIVSDYDMPRQNGIEFLKTIREDHPDLPFILFTGKGSEDIASEAISAGVTDYLEKGTGRNQYTLLANRIRNAVERHRVNRKQQRQLDAIETAQEGIAVLDESGHYIYVNQAFADIHGYDPDEMIGERWELAYFEEDVPMVQDEILPEVEQTGYWHGETTSRRADDTAVEVDHTLAMTDQGELICTIRDISNQKERHRALQQSAARLKALFEHSPDMINIHDMDGSIIDPNPRLCEQTGYDADTLTGMKVWDLDQTIDVDEAQTLWEQMEVGDRTRLEGTYRRCDGSTFPVEIHIRRLRFEGGDRVITISRDITDLKEREETLREERNRLKRFASVVSHDLRNPLRVAEGRVELVREECDSEHVASIEEALGRMDHIIEDLLDLAREGRDIGATEPVAMRSVVESAWDVVATDAERADLRYQAESTALITIEADRDRVQQLVVNLLRNAIDHGGEDVTVTVGVLEDGFFVEDDGPGIGEEYRNKVFDVGYSTAEDETGFGLSIVKRIADAHGWEILVKEGATGGARFEIRNISIPE